MAGGTLTQELCESRLVLDLLVEDRERKVVGTVVLAGGEVAELRVAAHCTALCLDEHVQDRLDVRWVGRQGSRGTSRLIVFQLRRKAGDMAYVLIEHLVGDYETFEKVYLDDGERR